MKMWMTAVAACALLTACDGTIDVGNDVGDGNASAEGLSQDNMMSINAPGLDVKLKLPAAVRDMTEIDGDNALIYPGASFSGLHIQGSDDAGSVEMRFNTSDSLAGVVAWYRDTARTDFQIASARREGEAVLLMGEQKAEVGESLPFKLRLSPAEGGGTHGVLTLEPR